MSLNVYSVSISRANSLWVYWRSKYEQWAAIRKDSHDAVTVSCGSVRLAVSSSLTATCHTFSNLEYFYVQCSPISERGPLFKGSQALPTCPSDESIVKMKMSVEHCWNDTDWGEGGGTGRKTCPSAHKNSLYLEENSVPLLQRSAG